MIPGVNDSEEEMENIRRLLTPYRLSVVELLPYHRMGEHKYAALNRQATAFEVPSSEKMDRLKRIFEQKATGGICGFFTNT